MSNEQCEISGPLLWPRLSHTEAAEVTEEQALNRRSPVCLSQRHEAHKGGDGPREGTGLHIANVFIAHQPLRRKTTHHSSLVIRHAVARNPQGFPEISRAIADPRIGRLFTFRSTPQGVPWGSDE